MKKWPELLVLVRHCESLHNGIEAEKAMKFIEPNHRTQPTERGFLQARATGAWLRQNIFHKSLPDEIRVSTYLRSQLSEKELGITKISGTVPLIDSRVDERVDGILHDWCGPEFDESTQYFKKLQKKLGWYHSRSPGGENGPDVELRIHSLLQEFSTLPEKNTHKELWVTHGNWMLLFFRIFKNLTANECNELRETMKIKNASVCIIRRGVLERWAFVPYPDSLVHQ